MELTLIQAAIFCSYVIFITSKFGMLPSISESHYKLNESRQGYLFTLFCFSLSVTMILKENILFFIAGAGLALVGVASQFKWTGAFTDKLHYLGAFIGISSSLAGIYFHQNNQNVIYGLIPLLVSAVLPIKNKIFWVEIVSFLIIIASIR